MAAASKLSIIDLMSVNGNNAINIVDKTCGDIVNIMHECSSNISSSKSMYKGTLILKIKINTGGTTIVVF